MHKKLSLVIQWITTAYLLRIVGMAKKIPDQKEGVTARN